MLMKISIFFSFPHSDTVIIGIPDNLVLDLFPSLQAFVDEHLLGVGERRCDKTLQLTATRGKSRAKATEGVRCTN